MNTVFVIGAGTMGLDIAQVFAASGKSVVVRDISDDIVSKAAARLEKGLQKRVERGKMAAEAKEALLARIRFTTALGWTRCASRNACSPPILRPFPLPKLLPRPAGPSSASACTFSIRRPS